MTATVVLLLAMTLTVAVVDWVAVSLGKKAVEYVAKPGTMVLLIATVLAMEPTNGTARWCFVVALAFSMLGDIFLMLPDRQRFFVFGLGAFLVGHLAYVPGLVLLSFGPVGFLAGLAFVLVAMATVGRRVVAAVKAAEPDLLVPVMVYMGVISLMVACAFATAKPVAIIGALLFYGSDSMIAWNGFVKPFRNAGVAIMVTYHLGQIGLVLALV
jgi:uncharacterized membrane protein YhhN